MTEICILYSIYKRDLTIYSIRKLITEKFGIYTKPSHGTIHPALKKLTSEGFVTVRETISDGGRKSCYYSVTEKGKKYLSKLILSDLSSNPSVFINDISIRTAALGVLSENERKQFIENTVKFLDLYEMQTKRAAENEYTGLDYYQTESFNQCLKCIADTKRFLCSLKV